MANGVERKSREKEREERKKEIGGNGANERREEAVCDMEWIAARY